MFEKKQIIYSETQGVCQVEILFRFPHHAGSAKFRTMCCARYSTNPEYLIFR